MIRNEISNGLLVSRGKTPRQAKLSVSYISKCFVRIRLKDVLDQQYLLN